MSTSTSWIARNHEDLHKQANQTATYLAVSTNVTRMGLTGASSWISTEFTPKLNNMNTAFNAWLNEATRTSVIIANLSDAEKAFVPAYRKLYTGFLRDNPLVTDADLLNMGLPKHSSGERHPAPVPTTVPEYELRLPAPAVIELIYYSTTSEGKRHSKPEGVHGVEVRSAILSEPPAGWDALTESSFDTASPITFTFAGEQRGQRFYFALRWENTRGDKGPWSEINSAVIP
jgi:hypothetical protein